MHELHSDEKEFKKQLKTAAIFIADPFIHPPMLHTFTTELKIWRKHSDAQVGATGSDHPPC